MDKDTPCLRQGANFVYIRLAGLKKKPLKIRIPRITYCNNKVIFMKKFTEKVPEPRRSRLYGQLRARPADNASPAFGIARRVRIKPHGQQSARGPGLGIFQ